MGLVAGSGCTSGRTINQRATAPNPQANRRLKLKLQNRRRCHALHEQQLPMPLWMTHTGHTFLLPKHKRPLEYHSRMCPAGIATLYPAGELLVEWSQLRRPTKTGRPWSKEEMWEAVARGPHQSSLSPDALVHFAAENANTVKVGQATLVLWDNIKDAPPPQLKISPNAAIPHKSKAFWSILDLSFRLCLKNGGFLDSVSNSTMKMAPQGALDQLGYALSCIMHAFTEADDNNKIFMAKWDIKDGFCVWIVRPGKNTTLHMSSCRRRVCQSHLSSPPCCK